MSSRLLVNRSSRSNKTGGWSLSDYSRLNGFPSGTNFLKPNLIFNSDLALKGPLFTSFGSDEYKKYLPSVVKTPPIPGPYPYDIGWEGWGGDEKYLIGDSHYNNFTTSFGVSVMMAAQAYYESGGTNRIAKAKLKRLTNGSHLVFNWFAGLVDYNGEEVSFNPKTKAGMLKSMIKMLINGDQTIDLDMIFNQLDKFTNNLSDRVVAEEVYYYISSLKEYLSNVLFDRIEVIPWQELITRRQKGMLYMYQWFLLYKEDPAKHKDQINEFIQDFIDTANQMTALFSIILHVSLILDCLLDQMGYHGSVIPMVKRKDILKNVTDQLLGLFMINTVLYRDLADLCSNSEELFDMDTILQVETTQLDYCDKLSELIGLVMAIFHALIQGRRLYDAF